LGGWADYARVREERKAAAAVAAAAAKAKPDANGRRREGQKGKPPVSKNRNRRIGELEREVAAAEETLAKLEEELSDPDAWYDGDADHEPVAREHEHHRHDERDEDAAEQEHHGGHPERESGVWGKSGAGHVTSVNQGPNRRR